MSSADNVFYQSAKGGLAMRLNNAEQIAQGKEGIRTGLAAQQLTLDDDLEHAKTNRDTAIFGISLGGGGAYKVAYGIGKSIGGKYLSRATSRLQNAVDRYRKVTANQPEGTPDEAAEPDVPDVPATGYQIQTPRITETDEPTGGLVEDAYGQKFNPSTLDMSDPNNPKPFPADQEPGEFPQSQNVARDGFGNEFDPSKVDTSAYRDPQVVPDEGVLGEEGAPEEAVRTLPAGSQTGQRLVGEATTTELRPAGGFRAPTETLNPGDADRADAAVRSAGRPDTNFLSDAQNARLQEIRNSNPILSEDNVGDLKKMGLDFGELSPEEVDTGARMLLGDGAVEGLSSMLGVAGGVVGAALPVLGVIGDLAGLGFAIKGLSDSAEAVKKETEQQGQLRQAIADTNIPIQVSKQGSAPVLDTSAMRTGGFQNF